MAWLLHAKDDARRFGEEGVTRCLNRYISAVAFHALMRTTCYSPNHNSLPAVYYYSLSWTQLSFNLTCCFKTAFCCCGNYVFESWILLREPTRAQEGNHSKILRPSNTRLVCVWRGRNVVSYQYFLVSQYSFLAQTSYSA